MDLKISFRQLDGYGMVLIRLLTAIHQRDHAAIRACVKEIDKKAVSNKKNDGEAKKAGIAKWEGSDLQNRHS